MPEQWEEIMWGCDRWLSAHRPQTAAQTLRILADSLDPGLPPDRYGEGHLIDELELRLAELLGTEGAVLFPTGTMTQQIALRVHCQRRGTQTVAFHPTCHLELWENAGYAHLHGLKAELVGHRDRLIELEDLRKLRGPVGAVLFELPQREIGGQLPEWDDLLAQVEWVRERGAALHLDGARIWEAAPYYGRPVGEIAALFDTVYVSLYKGLGGLAGSALAGPQEVLGEARLWRRRHGGDLFRMFPLAASGRRGLETLAPQMPRFLEHARELAGALRGVPGVTVVPDPPQTPLFHVQLETDEDVLWERALRLAGQRKVWLFNPPQPTVARSVCRVEINIGEPALEISPAEAAELFGELVA